MSPRRRLQAGLVLLGLLVLFSFYLGYDRIIQVDEAERVMEARLLATHRNHLFNAPAPLMLLGPVMAIARAATTSAGLFHGVRALFVVLLWANVVLMVKAAGVRLRSAEGVGLLLLGATLAPLWDYGFEIRHDNVLLTGILGIWLLVRPLGRPLRGASFWAGLVAALLQFVAFKAFLYTLPLLALSVLWLAPARGEGRLRALAWTAGGILAGILAARLLYGLTGTWAAFAHSFQDNKAQAASAVARFAPWDTLGRLPRQVPLLTGAALALLGHLAVRLGRDRRALLDPAGEGPEMALLLLCVGVLLVNPTPFPYNLVLVVPAAFIACARMRGHLAAAFQGSHAWLLGGALVAAHLFPWWTAVARHLDYSNERQMGLMELSEALTDPAKHRVFDGSGLVPMRDPVGYHWLIHTFTIKPLSDGTWPSIRSLLAQNEVPVILASYRTDWLSDADKDFIQAHYIGLAEDIAVLGLAAQGGARDWEALAQGRYHVQLVGPEAKGGALEVDGRRVQPGVLELARGQHHFTYPAGAVLQVFWLGPALLEPPLVPPAPRPLFVNWY